MARSKYNEIYRIRNLVTGWQYIGFTTTSYVDRWRNHRCQLGMGRHTSKAMLRDFQAFGFESFEVTIVEKIPKSVGDTVALEREWDITLAAQQAGVQLYNSALPYRCVGCHRKVLGKPSVLYCDIPRCFYKRLLYRKHQR